MKEISLLFSALYLLGSNTCFACKTMNHEDFTSNPHNKIGGHRPITFDSIDKIFKSESQQVENSQDQKPLNNQTANVIFEGLDITTDLFAPS